MTGRMAEQLKTGPDNFLADELRSRVATAPVAFDFKLQLVEKGDQRSIQPRYGRRDARS